ncbi:hypothetical protein ABIE28_000449 [Devosia sp. 2618]
MMGTSFFTSPFGGEVAPLGAGEGDFPGRGVWARPTSLRIPSLSKHATAQFPKHLIGGLN